MKKYIRYISLILCIVMVLCSSAECFAAAPISTTSIALSQTEGTVTVRNASGKVQKTKENMKLYNGFSVATSDKSYAYIDLGDLKYVKLDASSEAEIKMSGKKLEVLLKSGEIFFDVDEKLKNDESFKIRAGKTTTNIRGTAGEMSANRIVLLNGKVTSTNAQTGQSFFVDAGFTLDFSETNQQGALNKIENLKDAVSGFTATEIEKNESLAEKIIETFGEEAVKAAAQAAEEKLAEDQKQAAEEKAAEVAEAELAKADQPKLSILATDESGNLALAEDAVSVADYSAVVQAEAAAEIAYYYNGSSSDSKSDTDTDPEPDPTGDTVTITFPEDGEEALSDALSDPSITTVSLTVVGEVSVSAITVATGKTLNINGSDCYLNVTNFINSGTVDNQVWIDANSVCNNGMFTNEGRVFISESFKNSEGVVFNNIGESELLLLSDASFENNGRITCTGTGSSITREGGYIQGGTIIFDVTNTAGVTADATLTIGSPYAITVTTTTGLILELGDTLKFDMFNQCTNTGVTYIYTTNGRIVDSKEQFDDWEMTVATITTNGEQTFDVKVETIYCRFGPMKLYYGISDIN